MYQILALIQIVILTVFLVKTSKKQGLTLIVDQGKVMIILWMTALILYNLRLSSLYNPNIHINLVVGLIILSFFILTRKASLKEEDITDVFQGFKEKSEYKIYSRITDIIFIVATLVFLYNVYKYGLEILEANKVEKQQLDHYAGYIVSMLVLVGEIKYILYRRFMGIKDGIVFLGSVIILFLTLNRGPITFLVITIALYEVFNFINIKSRLSRKQIYITYGGFIAAILGFIWFFGYIGNIRMEYAFETVYETNLWEHYGVSTLMPSGFVWVFLYLTSPLENVAFSLANQAINFTYFNNLFYPFIKLFANIIGKGEEYKLWLLSRTTYVPHLESVAGLNAATFIPEAFQDFGILGFIVYLGIYLGVAYISIKIIKKKVNLTSITKLLIYTNTLSLLLWSVFTNSFRMSIIVINIAVLVCIEIGYKKWTQWRIR
ncbi:MAG: O-antigen polymerase [Clostridium sp.]